MWDINDIKKYLKNTLKEDRYKHTMGVVETALELAEIYDVDLKKAELSALCHDVAKNTKKSELLNVLKDTDITEDELKSKPIWHAIAGPVLAKEIFKIEDSEVLDAIRWHTTGKENMSKLEKIIYLADMIEPSRDFEGVCELRKLSKVNLNLALEKSLNYTIKHLIDKNLIIDMNTIKARNYLIFNKS